MSGKTYLTFKELRGFISDEINSSIDTPLAPYSVFHDDPEWNVGRASKILEVIAVRGINNNKIDFRDFIRAGAYVGVFDLMDFLIMWYSKYYRGFRKRFNEVSSNRRIKCLEQRVKELENANQ